MLNEKGFSLTLEILEDDGWTVKDLRKLLESIEKYYNFFYVTESVADFFPVLSSPE